MRTSKALFVAVATAAIGGAAHASSTGFESLSNAELLKRWNVQADWYDKAYLLEGCADRKVPSSNRSFLLCDTAGGKGFIAFRRNAGRLETVEYTMKGSHPLNDASMFVRFVRSSRSGDMAAVGANLVKAAHKDGSACINESAAQVCANFSSGEYSMSALERKQP